MRRKQPKICAPARAPAGPVLALGRVPATLLAAAAIGSILVALLAAAPALGQDTGRIAGRVTDAESGRPLQFANVAIVGTPFGASANRVGEYTIDLVPVGTYAVRASYIGYRSGTVSDVGVGADRTTPLDMAIAIDAVKLPEIIVRPDEKMVKLDRPGTIRVMDDEEMGIRSIDSLEDALGTHAGVIDVGGEMHVRGGRETEVKRFVDGIAITDPASGTGNLEVSLSSLKQYELLSGGFDAEYGNAQSAVINLQTREGGDEFSADLKYMTDDYGAPEKTFDNFDNIMIGMGGPLPIERLRFYLSGEGRFTDTYLKTTEERPEHGFGGDALAIRARDRQSMLGSGQLKLSYVLVPGRKLTFEYLLSRRVDEIYDHRFSRAGYWSEERNDWAHVPLDSTYAYYNAAEHTPTERASFDARKLVWRANVDPGTFYVVRLAQFVSEETSWLHEDPNDYWWQAYVGGRRWTDPDSDGDLNPEPGYYRVTGDHLGWSRTLTRVTTLKADLTREPDETHRLKTGIEIVYNDLDVKELNLGGMIPSVGDTADPSFAFFDWDRALHTAERHRHNIYRGFPAHGAIYVQDRMKYEGMIVRGGLRLDWSDPGPASAIGEHQIWRERVKAVISPRLGIAHPISEHDALHFHYGRFYQMPHLTAFYEAGEDLENAAAGRIVGFSGLDPEVNVSYQFGAEHQFSDNLAMDVTGFYRDIFGLLATEEYERGPTDGSVYPYVNKDYASVRGVEVTLTKRFSNYFAGNVAYTWLHAKGVSSDENQGAQSAAAGLPRQPLKEIPLRWDERHSVAGFLYVSDPGNWEVTFDFSYGSGLPYTPRFLGQKEIDPESMYSGRLPSRQVLDIKGTKKYRLYGREFDLFFQALNVFDKRNVDHLGTYGSEHYTATGDPGGGYVETDPEGRERLEALNDPSIYSEGRVIRIGVAIDW